jgi:DNA-binding NarL/FixJ family response regulator
MNTRLNQQTTTQKKRIVIVDDHPVVSQGLALFLNQQPDLMVCGQAEDAKQALEMIATCKPDLALIDLSLKGRDGLDLIKDLKLRHPDLLLLVVSMLDEIFYAERAFSAGAKGYVMKQEATDKLLLAVRKVLAGEIYVSGQAMEKILHQLSVKPNKQVTQSPMSLLSDREMTVFHMIGQAYSTNDIAKELNLSVKTVESHRSNIKEKLSLNSGTELVQSAVMWLASEKSQ